MRFDVLNFLDDLRWKFKGIRSFFLYLHTNNFPLLSASSVVYNASAATSDPVHVIENCEHQSYVDRILPKAKGGSA
jgi:hypothetical protein